MENIHKVAYEVVESGCWVCIVPAYKRDGYPYMTVNRKLIKVHRWLFEREKGEIPPGMILRHTCDNKLCVNPDHGIIGTHADNVRDRVERNRSAIGDQNGRAKLTNNDVGFILRCLRFCDAKYLAGLFGVDSKVISNIKNNKTWRHISREMF